MALWLWRFWAYSFAGFLLEKAFAAATCAQRRTLKGFLLLPLCPVYGLGVTAVLALPAALTESFWRLAFWEGLTATAVEYAVHFLYDRLLGVWFWDYTWVAGNVRGRVCLPFSLVWSLLLAALLPWAERWLTPLLAAVPNGVTCVCLLVFAVDAVCSAQVLRVTGDTERLRLLSWA